MPGSRFSPFPAITRGSPEALDQLAELDRDIRYLKELSKSLADQRRAARATPSNSPASASRISSEYLSIAENQRRAADELDKLQEERLKLVVLCGLTFKSPERGSHFPYISVDQQAKDYIQTYNTRLLAVSTVAFFGSGITYSTIFSASRGSIGLMSISWAAFAISFSICVFGQIMNSLNPPFLIVAYPVLRRIRFTIIFVAASASFVGVVLMTITVALLGRGQGGSESQINVDIDPSWGGFVSFVPVAGAFLCACIAMAFNNVAQSVTMWKLRRGNARGR